MVSTLSALVFGFLLGMRHATDPDHVVAVTTIVSRERSFARASSVGAMWGVGHTATILLVGGAIILFRLAIPPRLGLAMEFAVALMLIVLGVRNLAAREAPRAGLGRPLAVGFVHGLAGSAAVALLVLAAMPTPLAGIVYLLLFGAGTVAGMAAITMLLALPSVYGASRLSGMERYLRMASGALSLCFGLVLAHQIGVVDGLFSATPQWTPK